MGAVPRVAASCALPSKIDDLTAASRKSGTEVSYQTEQARAVQWLTGAWGTD